MAHFYLTLPSNSSEKYYPNNTLTQYTTKLREDITLKGDWEVGLTEILYPKTWYNISRAQSIVVRCEECSEVTPEFTEKPFKRSYSKIIRLTAGYYKTMEILVAELNSSIQTAYAEPVDSWNTSGTIIVQRYVKDIAKPKFTYNAANKKVYLEMQGKMSIRFTENLREILGFTEHDHLFNTRRRPRIFRADRTADIECGLHALYVYCDILEHVPVGDTSAPLLRILDIVGESGSMIRRSYEKPRYVPLQKKHFGSLEMHIRDSHGNKIPFESGTVVITLHFRQTKNNYYLA